MNLQKSLIAVVALVLSGSAIAHHGWGGYNVDFELEATVTEVKFINPHDQIFVEDAEGNNWHFLLAPPYRNRRFGYDETAVAVGDTVRIVGQRSRTRFEGKVHFIYNSEGENIYTYYYDSGTTSWDRSNNSSRR